MNYPLVAEPSQEIAEGRVFDLQFEKILERAVLRSNAPLHIIGSCGPVSTALLFASSHDPSAHSGPNILICPDDDSAEELVFNLRGFGVKLGAPLLTDSEVSPYSGLLPSLSNLRQRLAWLSAMDSTSHSVFVATVSGLAQRTLPPAVFRASSFSIRKASRLDSSFFRKISLLGYSESPRVEDLGQFSRRGGIVDIFSPAHAFPVRIELFDDEVETIRSFDPDSQRSLDSISEMRVVPARGVLLDDDRAEGIQRFSDRAKSQGIDLRMLETLLQDLSIGRQVPELEFLVSDFYPAFATALDYVPENARLWLTDTLAITKAMDERIQGLKEEKSRATGSALGPEIENWLCTEIESRILKRRPLIQFSLLNFSENESVEDDPSKISLPSFSTDEFRRALQTKREAGLDEFEEVKVRLNGFLEKGYQIWICCHSESQLKRLAFLLDRKEISFKSYDNFESARLGPGQVALVSHPISSGLRLPEEKLLLLTDHDFFGKQDRRTPVKRAALPVVDSGLISDFKPGEYVVHSVHGVGIFDGLKVMSVQGIDAEFIQLTYKDNDRLYLPVFRIAQIQKFSGLPTLDKLGGQNWAKTKIRVRNELRDVANDLLKLYAARSEIQRPPYPAPDDRYRRFEAAFPYNETPDQEKAVDDVLRDLQSTKPMDRLVCGDVGFGKTEVALRTAFMVASQGRQVVVLVPTTVLAFQHAETFKKRFSGTGIRVESFSRFSTPAEVRKNLKDLKSGAIQIAVGTHRLLSKDVEFKDLCLLILDEEQKFGVTHKEKIRKLRANVDTLAMSATPIPRTLNMSLVGIRDLSLISTAPRDRLPIRTFICKFDEETVRKAILSEIKRGGQVFYVHNRVQSIYSLHDELKALVPEARIRVGHGQMEEGALEDVMVAFFNHEFDVLLSTTIIESGVDIARANTMIVDRADTFGLSQLYQLRGRIGRSKERAYCYLLVPTHKHLDPDAQERLRVLQENSSLGSGFRIAQHDLELRGAGNILGEEQSGHINAVGYELYIELLQEVLHELRGLPVEDKSVEPEMNLKIPALIPDQYVPDIRIRLNIYRKLSDISGIHDLDEIENELRDQFGELPEPVYNLFGVMVIRRQCKDLGVRDISVGSKSLSLAFTSQTKVDPAVMVQLATREKAKYSLTPDSRLLIRVTDFGWQSIFEELESLKKKVLRG